MVNWTFVRPGFIVSAATRRSRRCKHDRSTQLLIVLGAAQEAAPPPESPVDCALAGSCGNVEEILLVPHGSTNVRVGALPWTKS